LLKPGMREQSEEMVYLVR
jgi:hypothetical protein